MTESRKVLYEEEIYPMINVHTRAAFLLSDGSPDSGKSLHFSNIKDDAMLRFTRLIFRYRLNLDDLFQNCNEPPLPETAITSRADEQYNSGESNRNFNSNESG